jgi:hypothetical protein
MKQYCFVLLFAILTMPVSTVTSVSADTFKNHFASILLNNKKIGQVHYTTRHDKDGTLLELNTRASHSILGIEVFHHTLHMHEFWEADEMKRLWGNVNEDGTAYEMDVTREPSDYYVGTLNNQMIKLPADAFPIAVWHYAITEHTQLFSIPEFQLLNVKVQKSSDYGSNW